ncbi:hypothetical protein FKM82_004047 [Ascaphus truei]
MKMSMLLFMFDSYLQIELQSINPCAAFGGQLRIAKLFVGTIYLKPCSAISVSKLSGSLGIWVDNSMRKSNTFGGEPVKKLNPIVIHHCG